MNKDQIDASIKRMTDIVIEMESIAKKSIKNEAKEELDELLESIKKYYDVVAKYKHSMDQNPDIEIDTDSSFEKTIVGLIDMLEEALQNLTDTEVNN